MAATMDDLVDVLKRIADQLDLLPKQNAEDLKVQQKLAEEYALKQVMDLKQVDAASAVAIIDGWKRA